METYHYQIIVLGYRTPWAFIPAYSRRFKSRKKAEAPALRAACFYKAEVRQPRANSPAPALPTISAIPIFKLKKQVYETQLSRKKATAH
ncbi:hypothetical protein HGH90_05405 [Chitinophaga sp. Ak27]|nr:hypothetical protein [Chitinophaga sp. Ak27]